MDCQVRFAMLFGTLALLFSACGGSDPVPTPTRQPSPSVPATFTAEPTAIPTETPEPSSTAVPISEICTPLAEHELVRITEYISNGYAEPIGSNLETGHHGVDFSYYYKDGTGPIIDGTPVQSMFAGRVAGLGIDRLPYGNMLVVETTYENLPAWVREMYRMQPGSSLYLLYGHMLAAPILSIGQLVACGETVGHVGNSGFSGNPHLHLETRVGPSGIDLPTMIFYDSTATLAEQEAYIEWRRGSTWTKFDPTPFLQQAGAPNGTIP